MGQNHFFEFLIIRQTVGGIKIYFDNNKHLCYNEKGLRNRDFYVTMSVDEVR